MLSQTCVVDLDNGHGDLVKTAINPPEIIIILLLNTFGTDILSPFFVFC